MASAATNVSTGSAPQAPTPSALAGRYALALLGIVDDLRKGEPNAADRIAGDLDRLFRLWREDDGFRAFVEDPRLDSAEQRRGAFGILAAVGIGTEVRNLVGVMIGNRRLGELPAVATAFRAQLAARRGQQTAQVITAHPLSDTQRAQIVARLTEAGFSGVQLQESVDPSLLGGLVVRIGSRLYDNSIKSKLQRLQYAMKGAA
ncbi:ATP synthase F1 subunit delta [Falsiroseomonas oryzae]|uniref:ATP synthase F1 subunit delta n=1 Tax=Falsiroseomonas oryzae TaxID=2766473 RepID=UPI0022EA1D91|nr:ATP synthase F1 subunit delta [Roseomonas sp. MO-31]